MIVASQVLWDQPQRDGRRYVRERHTDHLGVAHLRDYLADVGVDVAAAATAYASVLTTMLASGEVTDNLSRIFADGDLAVVARDYSTAQQNADAARQYYRVATRIEAVMMGAYLSILSDAQLKSLFGLTDAQVAQLRTKVNAAKATLDEIRAATGA